jgi:hypothetical protein
MLEYAKMIAGRIFYPVGVAGFSKSYANPKNGASPMVK